MGFSHANDIYQWVVYVTIDFILFVYAPILYYFNKRRNNKYICESINMISVMNYIKKQQQLFQLSNNQIVFTLLVIVGCIMGTKSHNFWFILSVYMQQEH